MNGDSTATKIGLVPQPAAHGNAAPQPATPADESAPKPTPKPSRPKWRRDEVDPKFCENDCIAGRFAGRCLAFTEYRDGALLCAHPNPDPKDEARRTLEVVRGPAWGARNQR